MTVLSFGTFDGLHPGHVELLKHARELGERLVVIGSRDSFIRVVKKREPRMSEGARLTSLLALEDVDMALLGDEWPPNDPYRLLDLFDFDVLALGHDQVPDDEAVRAILSEIGKPHVRVVRLPRFDQ
ncbi:MAG: adenylyltransferase/cytidyltransferase family protein [Kiritimatiellae bacterium]|nr:adenylyltransferase/cytidyltransferase family protein [Kiritimatiellia bacterium]